jgi:autotransporter translocation and assembly factor TamB
MLLPWNRESGRNSSVSAVGTYRLGAEEEETYALTVRFQNALVGEEGVYAARASGTLTVTPLRAPDGRIYPFAEGEIQVSRAEYAGSLEPQDIGEFEPPSLLYRVVIDAPTKILLRTEDVDAELGGELTVNQKIDRQEIVGDLDVLRGTYQFFQKTFRVTRGALHWDDPTTRLPRMDITAETREGGYVIMVELSGRPDEPSVVFSARKEGEDAGLTEGEIIQLLTVGATGLGALGVPTGVDSDEEAPGPTGRERALMTVGKIFLNQVERELAREIGIVDDVEIETESEEGDFEPVVGVRKWVTPELSLQYRQGLSGSYLQNLAVEYRLGRILFLRGGMIRLPLRTSGAQEYNLDLKIRREY